MKHFDASHLQSALLSELPVDPGWNWADWDDVLDAAKLRPAAVLIGLIARPDGWQVLLTRRNEHMSDHAGQVAFPGGRIDSLDAGPVEAALRETWEEVGIASDLVQPIGFLPRFATISNYIVTPVVAILSPQIQPTPQQSEVAAIFEAPLRLFFDPSARRTESRVYLGRTRSTPVIDFGEYRIWGATASMMLKLVERIALVAD